jgi:predicted RNA-binding protein YlxR (DUF448 family)
MQRARRALPLLGISSVFFVVKGFDISRRGVFQMKRGPERTCIGCRGVFEKDAVIRIVSGPDGIVIDYREKLPGRAAYVCPTAACVTKALSKENLSRALHCKVRTPDPKIFIDRLAALITEKIRSLIVMSAKADKLAAGYSAVHDAVEKGRVLMLLYATDLSPGTKGKVASPAAASLRWTTLFTREELGTLLNRELVGVIGIEDKGLADALWSETERLKVLIKNSE